ncbi:MAG: hypothetical protein K2Y02_00250 [Burkholderiaceae bacterium]|nr:hypothetical protein [Burkholderiaceae bacterium]
MPFGVLAGLEFDAEARTRFDPEAAYTPWLEVMSTTGLMTPRRISKHGDMTIEYFCRLSAVAAVLQAEKA